MIPVQAVEAAYRELPDGAGVYVNRDDLRVILEAAAPHIRAQELQDAADCLANVESLNTSGAISEWLRTRAAELTQP